MAEVPFAEILGFPPTTVLGHKGVFRSVRAGDRRILVMAGRVHLYEGHPPAKVVHGVRSMVLAGTKIIVLTNACGGLRPGMKPGEPVLIRDHINFTGVSPLFGPNPDRLGPRFVDLTGLLFAAAAAGGAGAGPDADRGRLCRLPRPDVRDAGGDPDGRPLGWRHGRHVDGAGGDRHPSSRRRGAGPVAGHQPRRRPAGRRPRPRAHPGGRARHGGARWAVCSTTWCGRSRPGPASDFHRHGEPQGDVAIQGLRAAGLATSASPPRHDDERLRLQVSGCCAVRPWSGRRAGTSAPA